MAVRFPGAHEGDCPKATDPLSLDYDVVNSKGDWTSGDPFTLTGIGAHLYGRGVIDNKGEYSRVGRS